MAKTLTKEERYNRKKTASQTVDSKMNTSSVRNSNYNSSTYKNNNPKVEEKVKTKVEPKVEPKVYTNKYERKSPTTSVERNSHYDSSKTYDKINETLNKNEPVQIDQEKLNAWMDNATGRQGIQREKQDVGDQKLMKMTGNIVGDIVNTGFKGYDLFKEFQSEQMIKGYENNRENLLDLGYTNQQIDEFIQKERDKFDINDENNWSNLIDKQIEKNRQDIYKDTNAVEQFALQTVESAGQFGAHMLLAMATGGSSLATMGLQAGTDKAYRNLQEGYDVNTSIGNGVMTGIMTALVEKLPVDNFGKLVTSRLSHFSLGAIASQMVSEGAEEALEYLIEPQIDRIMLGKETEYNASDLFMSVALGMSSGGLIGTVANAVPIIKTRKQFNQLKADMETLIEYKNTNQLTEEETVTVDSALTLAQKALNQFESTSVVGNAIQFESDIVKKLSAREIQENFNKFLQPQVDQEITLNQEQQAVNSILETSQKVLAQKGIQMDALQYSKLDVNEKTEVDKIQSFANNLNTNVVFNSDLVAVNGQVIDGMYIPEVGIVINPKGTRKAMSTFVHELTHGTESSQYYVPLKKLLIDNNNNYMSEVMKIQKAYKTVTDLSLEDATKEFVAIETQNKLGNEQFVEGLVKYNTSLANRIYEGVINMLSITDTEREVAYNFKKAFKNTGINPTLNPQFSIATYEDGGRDYLKNWLDNSDDVSKKDKQDILDHIDEAYDIVKKLSVTGDYEDFTSWSQTKLKFGPDGTPMLSVIVPNGEYEMNIDFSQVCKKRKTLNKVLNELVRSGDLDNRILGITDIGEINRIIKEHEFEIACGLCFVDSKRYRQGLWAESFTDTYNTLVRSLKPVGSEIEIDEYNFTNRDITNPTENLLKNVDESKLNFTYINEVLAKYNTGKAIYRYAKAIKENPELRSILNPSEIMASEGLDALRLENPKLFELVNSHQGSAKPKLSHGEVPYGNDILLDKRFTKENAYAVGGVRVQSFSDYMANMFFDYVQMIAELEAKGLPAHAYTKEPAFARLFGLTGMKINLSIVPKAANLTLEQQQRFNKMTKAQRSKDAEFIALKKRAGLDENGNYIIEDETFPLEEALEIQNTEGYDKNVGIIWVGVSDAHIQKMLDDDNVPFIIPYHKSSLNPAIARMRNIDLYNDYTKAQNTRYNSEKKKKVPANIWSFDFYGDLQKTNDPRQTAENYKNECKKRGYLPKFDKFASHPNYYKLLVDFRVYDKNGNYAPQGEVKLNLPENYSKLVEASLAESQDTSNKLDDNLQSVIDEVRSVLKLGNKKPQDKKQYSIILNSQGNNNGNIHVAENPNQINNITNTNLTANNDIRYSIGFDPRKASEKAIRNASSFIPNHEIIRSKYPEFDILNFNKAMLEQLSTGRVTEKTFDALKDDLIKNVYGDDFTEFNKATKQVDEFLDDSIKYFLTDAKYKSNKEYMDKISTKAIELLKAYNRLDKNKIESTYDAVEKQQQARDLIKKKKIDRKISVAQTVDRLVNFGNSKHVSRFRTLEQVLDEIADGDVQLRSELRDTLEMKRFEAQTTYVETLNEYNNLIKDVVKLGIKGGSKESKATQWFIEKHKEDGSPYDLDQLLLEFDYTMPNGKKAYDNIQKAAKMISNAYEKLFEDINKNREDIYGDIDANNEIKTAELEAKFQEAKRKLTQIRDELRNHPSEKLQAVLEQQREEVIKLAKQVKHKTARDENGDSIRRQKLQYRKNYAHHKTKQNFFSTLKSKVDGSAVREVPSYLAGISDDAEPKTAYAKFFSQQTGGAYEADAVEGFAEYIQDAARIIAYDPYVDYLRDFTDDIRALAEGDNMSDFIRYLTEYTNDIAGKTSTLDRDVRSKIGDKMFGILKLINNRVKANAILGNVRTATTQIFNIPNALGIITEHGGVDSINDVAAGLGLAMNSIFEGKEKAWANSPFIQSRYFDSDTGKTGFISSLEGISNFMLTKGDELSTKTIWSIAYQQGKRLNVDDPVFYADDLTRRSVAGRGVGEVPVALQSQFMNLMIPFQVETNNAFRTMSSMVKNKEIGPLLTILIANFLFNGISEWLYNDRILFDPIDIIWDAINEDDEEKDGVEIFKETSKKLLGEVISSYPGGAILLTTFFGLTRDDSEELFGDSDPTRYGTGNVGLSVLGSAAKDLVQGNYLDAVSDLAANFALPGGGKQLQRTIEALQVNGMLPQFENGQLVKEPVYYTGSGKIGYVTNPDEIMDNPENFFDFAKQVMFGKWTGKEAQEYIDNGFKSMGKTQTNIFDALNKDMNNYDSYSVAEEVYEAKKNMTGKDGKQQFIEYLNTGEFTPDQKNEIYDTYYGDSPVTTRINEFAKGANLDANQTFKVKDILSTTVSLKDSNGNTIDHSKALSIRKQLDELGLYADVVSYIQKNNLELGDFGLNKTVGAMSNDEFQNKYKEIYGESYKAQSDDPLYNAYTSTFGSLKSKSGSKKSNKQKTTFSFEEEKSKIDNILAKVYGGNTSTNNEYKKINNILNKVKSNKTSYKIDIKNKYSKLIKDYLKNHPEDTYLFK